MAKKFISFEKLSKKEQKRLNSLQRSESSRPMIHAVHKPKKGKGSYVRVKGVRNY